MKGPDTQKQNFYRIDGMEDNQGVHNASLAFDAQKNHQRKKRQQKHVDKKRSHLPKGLFVRPLSENSIPLRTLHALCCHVWFFRKA